MAPIPIPSPPVPPAPDSAASSWRSWLAVGIPAVLVLTAISYVAFRATGNGDVRFRTIGSTFPSLPPGCTAPPVALPTSWRVYTDLEGNYSIGIPGGAESIRVRPIHMGELKETQITYRVDDPYTQGSVRILLSQGRIYYIGISMEPAYGLDPEIHAFLDSFIPLGSCPTPGMG